MNFIHFQRFGGPQEAPRPSRQQKTRVFTCFSCMGSQKTRVFTCFLALWGVLGASWGPSGASVGPPWGFLEIILGPLWGLLAPILGLFGRFGPLGASLESSWGLFGASWALFWASLTAFIIEIRRIPKGALVSRARRDGRSPNELCIDYFRIRIFV